MRVAALLAMLVMSSCGLLPPPDWVANRQPLPSCGEEVVEQGASFDVAARECILDAFADGHAAELISTQRSVEGDPIISYIRVHANGTVEIFVDARADRFKSADWTRQHCDRIMPVADANEPPDLVYADDMVFVEDGCEALPLP